MATLLSVWICMDEKKIIELIASEYSWEQILYNIVSWEGLDPWDLDIVALSGSFLNYMAKMNQLDFKIPAKYIIIAAVLLRMKSDGLKVLDTDEANGVEVPQEFLEEGGAERQRIEINPITMPIRRQAKRKVMLNELIVALKKVLTMQDRRQDKISRHRKLIKIKEDQIAQRIEHIYRRINDILARINSDELRFSHLLQKGDKHEMIDTFLPLVYLDHNKRIECKQNEIFNEIYIKKREQT